MARYGCFFIPNADQHKEEYIPQVALDVHATIFSFSSRTVITQTYVNPSPSDSIPEVSYIFPLYDGSSIVGFTCSVGKTVLRGRVKSKKKAEASYQAAIEDGQSAAIINQARDASDIFLTRLGNIPAGGTVVIEIVLIAEIKQDTQTNGPRYTVPTNIAPRYGTSQDTASSPSAALGSTSINVDIVMEKESIIRSIQSPSHPIQVDIGRTSNMSDTTFEPYYASARLRENLAIREDFVLNIVASKSDTPVALLETHSTLPDQRALMVSLMPKFSLPPHAPEIVFLIDRSGSMGAKITTLKSALEVFLKSLPLGVCFNIISFGSRHSSLWPRSRDYNQESLEEALDFTATIAADMGGTVILAPIKEAVAQRYKDKDLELLLLTDGQVTDAMNTFDFVSQAAKEDSTRTFALGIGNSVSHYLVEGVARAGRGFAQIVLENEALDGKVIRMLKGALMPRIENYTLDIDMQSPDDEFEIIQRSPPAEKAEQSEPPATISFYNSDHKETEGIEAVQQPLPEIPIPAVLQAPTELPALFPFVQSTAYVLFSPNSGPLPEKITLRATSKHGPLSLDIPIQDIGQGEAIHQLAAKRATVELEQGRGWIREARDSEGHSIEEKHPSRINELVQEECQRLGIRFQVPGFFSAFVAVNEHSFATDEKGSVGDNAPEMRRIRKAKLNRRAFPAPAMAMGSFSPRMCTSSMPLSNANTPIGQGLRALGDSLPSSMRSVHRKHHQEEPEDRTRVVIRLQRYAGFWDLDQNLFQALSLDEGTTRSELETRFKQIAGAETSLWDCGDMMKLLATRLVVVFLEDKASDSRDVWDLVKSKAEIWMEKTMRTMKSGDQGVAREMMDGLISICKDIVL